MKLRVMTVYWIAVLLVISLASSASAQDKVRMAQLR